MRRPTPRTPKWKYIFTTEIDNSVFQKGDIGAVPAVMMPTTAVTARSERVGEKGRRIMKPPALRKSR
jgi:hypothetical protein